MIQVPEFLTVQNIGGLCLHSLAGICSFGVRKEKKKTMETVLKLDWVNKNMAGQDWSFQDQ